MRYLARREYSRTELAAKLRPYLQSEDDFEPPIDLEALLDDLVERGYLSDERAAAQLVHARRHRFGTQRITCEMHQKGISEALIEQVLPELKETELETARSVWQRKYATLPHDAKEKAKQMRFLLSRGFSMEIIFKVLKSPAPEE